MGWADLTEKDEQKLSRLVRYYAREGRKCRKAKAHLASIIMYTSALEAALLVMVAAYSEEIPIALLPKAGRKTRAILDWSLHDLIVVARVCDWLPAGFALEDDWDRKRAKIGDYAVVAKKARNCVHPARALEDLPKRGATKRYSDLIADVYDIAVRHLQAKVHQSLIKRLTEEENQRARQSCENRCE